MRIPKDESDAPQTATINMINNQGENIQKRFILISDGDYHVYKIPVRIFRIDSLNKEIVGLKLILDTRLKEVDVSSANLLTYNQTI